MNGERLQNFVNGTWVDSSGTSTLDVKNPATGKVLAKTPLSTAADVDRAVTTGNTFVLKPSEQVPLSQRKIFELIEKAGFPKGVVSLVNGGKEVVDAFCSHELVQGVSFVGSTRIAKHVYETASKHGKRV